MIGTRKTRSSPEPSTTVVSTNWLRCYGLFRGDFGVVRVCNVLMVLVVLCMVWPARASNCKERQTDRLLLWLFLILLLQLFLLVLQREQYGPRDCVAVTNNACLLFRHLLLRLR